MFRSEDVNLYEITIPEESKWDVLNSIGTHKRAMFAEESEDKNMNNMISGRIKACDELQQKLYNIIQKGEFFNINGIVRSRNDTKVLKTMSIKCKELGLDERLLIENMIDKVNDSSKLLSEHVNSYENFVERINDLKQSLVILENIGAMLPEGFQSDMYKDGANKGESGDEESMKEERKSVGPSLFSYFAGLMNLSEYDRFSRMCYRITRGNIFVKNMEVDTKPNGSESQELNLRDNCETIDPKTKKPIKKTLVFMLFHGKDNALSQKIANIVRAFEMYCISIPTDKISRKAQIDGIINDLNDSHHIYENTINEIEEIIRHYYEVSKDTNISRIEEMMIIARREKKMLRSITFLRPIGNNLSKGRLWIPARYEEKFQNDLKLLEGVAKEFVAPELQKIPDESIPKNMTRPTFFKGNDLVNPFMEAIEPVGVPNYKEINPAIFTITTFPYLFGVMFGDFGHGLIVLVAAIVLCCMSNKLKRDGGLGAQIASYRYMILLIGMFSTYNGLVYNDCFALKLPFFKSCYKTTIDPSGNAVFVREKNCMYGFGFDWAWGLAENDIAYTNSFKMKLS